MTKSMNTASSPLETAVLFLIFNRPDTTEKVFEAIRDARPPRLYIACDGARPGKEGEAELVDGLRKEILQKVDWPCEVHTLFREANLGCKLAVSGAIERASASREIGRRFGGQQFIATDLTRRIFFANSSFLLIWQTRDHRACRNECNRQVAERQRSD